MGIVLATFFSDVSHEMATVVLPFFLVTLGLGPAALGMIEGLADLCGSFSRLAGGVVGHHVRRKRPWTAAGYLVTTLATAGLAAAHTLGGLVTLRSAAWTGRGFRSPLRDYLLADAVEPTHYGRAYGLERAADMLGAVAGPLVAAGLIYAGAEFRTILIVSLVPGLAAAAAMFWLARDRSAPSHDVEPDSSAVKPERHSFPTRYWLLLGGVFLFGLGDFSRTFLIWLAGQGSEETPTSPTPIALFAVVLYTVHNLTSAGAAYPIGRWADRASKIRVLTVGYALGVMTNVILAVTGASFAWLVVVIGLSGVYIAVEETVEKAAVAEILPAELRSLGLGYLACANAVGDMLSSLYVGNLLQAGRPHLAFGIAAAVGAVGLLWLAAVGRRWSKL